MSLSIVLVQRDAEKLKFFNFAASLKQRVADDVEKNAYHILGGKKDATSVNLPLRFMTRMIKILRLIKETKV